MTVPETFTAASKATLDHGAPSRHDRYFREAAGRFRTIDLMMTGFFKAGGLKETLNASQIFVELSTVSPDASRRVAEAMSSIGVGYVRSPVSGSTAMAAQGSLTAVISGPAGAIERLNDFYAAFTRKTFVVGQAEEARYLKLVLNSLVGGTSALLAEALAMGRKGGLGNAEMME